MAQIFNFNEEVEKRKKIVIDCFYFDNSGCCFNPGIGCSKIIDGNCDAYTSPKEMTELEKR